MKRLALVIAWMVVSVAIPSVVFGDTALEAQVNLIFPGHIHNETLHTIAHQRAVEISKDFSHDKIRPGTAEVIGYNAGYRDPITTIVQGWLDSPEHKAILTDITDWRLFGCAEYVTSDGKHWFACVLGPQATSTPKPTPRPIQPAPTHSTTQPILLPNTSIR